MNFVITVFLIAGHDLTMKVSFKRELIFWLRWIQQHIPTLTEKVPCNCANNFYFIGGLEKFLRGKKQKQKQTIAQKSICKLKTWTPKIWA